VYWDFLSRVNLGPPSELEVVSAYAFPQAGYVVVEKHSGSSPWQFERVALDGTRRPLASISGACDWARVVPSPDGSLLAWAHSVQTSCSTTSLDGSTTTVSCFDASGTPVGVDGSVTPVTPPRCTDPPTTSSDVAASGRLLAVHDGKAGLAGVDPSRAFGCQ